MIYQQVEQFRRKRGDMAIKDREALKKSYEKAMAEFLARMPVEQRLAGLTPEDLAKFVNALPPEAREELRKKLVQ